MFHILCATLLLHNFHPITNNNNNNNNNNTNLRIATLRAYEIIIFENIIKHNLQPCYSSYCKTIFTIQLWEM